MNLDMMTTTGCHKAMEACVARLQVLGWANEDIGHHADDLITRLRAACKGCLDTAVAEFRQAIEAGMSGYAVPTFYATFIEAGVRAAEKFDADQQEEYEADEAAFYATE